jgi:serine/threonine protein kinase
MALQASAVWSDTHGAPSSESGVDLHPGQRVDRYRVLARLGQGGMAVVYLVEHLRLGSHHALKVHTSTKSSVKHRFAREGRLQARLSHRNVVAVTDVVDLGEHAGLIMEYVDGPSLSQVLRRVRPPLSDAVALFRGFTAGLGHAHDKGMVHRDLKPSNVLIEVRDNELVPKLTDFGLAKSLIDFEGIQTRTGATLGTPSYMPPEQIRDASKVDHRADLYGLGCLLYASCVGRPPFRGGDVFELLDRIEARDYLDPRKAGNAVPEGLALLIDDLLAPDPADRPANVREVLERIDASSDGEVDPRTLETVRFLQEEARNKLAIRPQMPHSAPVPDGPTRLLGGEVLVLAVGGTADARIRMKKVLDEVHEQGDIVSDAAQALVHMLRASARGRPYGLVIVDDGVRGGLLERRIHRDPRLSGAVVVRADGVDRSDALMAAVQTALDARRTHSQAV